MGGAPKYSDKVKRAAHRAAEAGVMPDQIRDVWGRRVEGSLPQIFARMEAGERFYLVGIGPLGFDEED